MPNSALLFAPFRLDPSNQELWRETVRLSVRPKTFAVLLYLAQHPQRLITKDELLRNVWPDVTVDDELLRGYIRELRQLLGDTAESPQFIETVAGRGYRFLPAVVAEVAADDRQSSEPATRRSPALFARAPIAVGILHSLTGMMAWTEMPVVDATLLAIEEINERGGVHGRRIETVIADGRSDESVFAREAETLITTKHVLALFGCWTSASRKSVLPIVEHHDHMLLYPVQYEGLEESPNIVYTGAAPNQQIIPALRWAFAFLGARRFFLVGWESVYSCAAHEIIRDEVAALGGEIVGEARLKPDGTDVPKTVRRVAGTKPDLIVNSTVGDLNILYSRVLRAAGITPDTIPTLYLSVGEIELLSLSAHEAAGDYAAWNYFQTVDRPENHAFVTRFRTRYGPQRVVADPMEASYIAAHLWAQAADSVDTDDVRAVRRAVLDQSFQAPEGLVRVDPENQHTWKTMRLGRITSGGQIETIWSSENPIRPEPFPPSRSRDQWMRFLAACYERWRGHWSKPKPLKT